MSVPSDPPLSVAADFKPSKYNYFTKYDDGTYYGYNFLYRTIVRVPSHAFGAVQQLLSSSKRFDKQTSGESLEVSSGSLQALREAYFLVPRDVDELALIKFRYFRSLFANDTLGLIVLPTLRCNFSCPYCFEFKKPITMNPEVEQALVGWVERRLKNSKHLIVSWFGGEPLLAEDTIVRLAEQFQSLCTAEGADYLSSLTTNGFLLDRRFQKQLVSLGIRMVQITLDGNQEAHDKSRKLANGRGSFERIYEKLLQEFPPEVRARVTVFFREIFVPRCFVCPEPTR